MPRKITRQERKKKQGGAGRVNGWVGFSMRVLSFWPSKRRAAERMALFARSLPGGPSCLNGSMEEQAVQHGNPYLSLFYPRPPHGSNSSANNPVRIDRRFLPLLPLGDERGLPEVFRGGSVRHHGVVALALPSLHEHRRRLVVLSGSTVARRSLPTHNSMRRYQGGERGAGEVHQMSKAEIVV